MLRARSEIIRLQRRLWQRQRRLIAASVTGADAAFRAYEARYLRRTRSFQREAPFDELLREVSQADVAYVGDYHTLKQAQRSFLKLVQRRVSERPLALALEFVQGRHQEALDLYLRGKLGEGRFLERIEYARHSIFDTWANFKPLLEEARKQRLPVVAIDLTSRPLAERDAYAARRIARALEGGAQVFALAGQLHVAPPHLPAQVSALCAARAVSVYQNCERIWWALQREGRELEVQAVLLRPGEWCLVNTPPQVVQQSYLDFLEGGAQPLEGGAFLESRFRMLARTVARFLGLDSADFRAALAEVSVYTAGDLSFLQRLPAAGFSAREIRAIEKQILSRESYYVPRARIAYLANLSLNHAAEEAAHFVRHISSGADDSPRSLADAFYARALEEAYAFCGSKIVNPRRKCPHEPEFEKLARTGDAFTREVAAFVLDHRSLEGGKRSLRRMKVLYRTAGPELFNAVTHSLGYMLGERLYYALATGKLRKSEVRELFVDPLDEDGDAFVTYLQLSRRLAGVRIPQRA